MSSNVLVGRATAAGNATPTAAPSLSYVTMNGRAISCFNVSGVMASLNARVSSIDGVTAISILRCPPATSMTVAEMVPPTDMASLPVLSALPLSAYSPEAV